MKQTQGKEVTQNRDQFQQDWNRSVDLTYDQNIQPPKTRGEKIFNGLSWALFGWIANALVSIKLADVLENFLRPIYKNYGQKLANSSVFKTFFAKPEQQAEAKSLAHSLFSVIALLPGGYSVLLPIKYMEDRKVALVKTFDRWFGASNPDENTKQLIEARHSYLEAAPKLNWGDMIKGRTLPVLGIVATHFAFASNKTNVVNLVTGKDTFKGLNHYIKASGDKLYSATKESRFESIRNTTDAVERHLDKGVQNHIAMYGKEHFTENGRLRSGNDRLKGYLNNISVDLLYSALVAGATYILGHLSAFKREEKKEIKRVNHEGMATVEKRKFHLDAPIATETNQAQAPATQLQNVQYDARVDASAQQQLKGA